MAVEKAKTQISWRELGDVLYADLPGDETVGFNITELHESWERFMKFYGIRQYVSSALAKMSFSLDPQLKIDILDAQMRAANKEEGAEEDLKTFKELAKAAKITWLAKNAVEIRTFLWKEFQKLKVEKVVAEAAGRETKAQVEARVAEETKKALKAKAISAGMTPEMAEVVFG